MSVDTIAKGNFNFNQFIQRKLCQSISVKWKMFIFLFFSFGIKWLEWIQNRIVSGVWNFCLYFRLIVVREIDKVSIWNWFYLFLKFVAAIGVLFCCFGSYHLCLLVHLLDQASVMEEKQTDSNSYDRINGMKISIYWVRMNFQKISQAIFLNLHPGPAVINNQITIIFDEEWSIWIFSAS